METKEKEAELVQLVRQLRDYVILDRKDYEKFVQNSSSEKFNESALEARDAHIKLLEQQLAHHEDWINYWKNKYEKMSRRIKERVNQMVEILKKVLKFIWAFLTVPYHETRR